MPREAGSRSRSNHARAMDIICIAIVILILDLVIIVHLARPTIKTYSVRSRWFRRRSLIHGIIVHVDILMQKKKAKRPKNEADMLLTSRRPVPQVPSRLHREEKGEHGGSPRENGPELTKAT